MTRKLNRTVLAGGVVYPAGKASTPELEALVTNPEFWSGEPRKADDSAPKSSPKRAPKKDTPQED